MVRTMNATDVKAKILALLDDVAAGDEILISKHGRVVARLMPARGPAATAGIFAGVAVSVAEDAELFGTGEVWDAR